MMTNINPLLLRLKSLDYLKGGMALDIGAGSGKDSIFLSDIGYRVTAIDVDDCKFSQGISDKNIEFIKKDITTVDLGQNKFDLILASHVLPFVSEDKIDGLIKNLISSLKKDALFCFSIFGKEDAWAQKKTMNFKTYEEILSIIEKNSVEIIFQSTEKGLGTTMKGEVKFWEVHKFIVRKR